MTPAEQYAAQAAQWQTMGRPDMATPLYLASLDQDPSNLTVRWHLAECLAYLQQADQAAAHYLQVAQAHAVLGQQQPCLAVCERIIQVAPHTFIYTAVGPMVRRMGREARTVCARAAEAHLRAGRQSEGLQILRLGTELDAHSPEVRLQLARIYKARHMNREAVEAMADAGDLLLASKRFREYAKVAELLLTLDPEHLHTLRELPRAYIELGRPHDAVRMLGRLTKVSPGDIVGYEVLAQAFAYIGHTDKALSVLERLIDELSILGRANKGDSILERAKEWCPNDLSFARALKRMEVPKPASTRRPAPPPEDMPPEGTVVLSIADLLVTQNPASAAGQDPSQTGGLEGTEVEGTLTLRLDPMMQAQLQRQDRPEPTSVLAVDAPRASDVPIPGPDDVHESLKLDASELIAALATDVPWDLMLDEEEEDEVDEEDQATALNLKPLTAKDIARAQKQAPGGAGGASPPPPPPAAKRSAAPASPARPPPLPPQYARGAAVPPPPPGEGEDAPTMAMSALTPADIAKALSRPPGTPPPPPPVRPIDEPQPPAMLSPRNVPLDDDEDAATVAKMSALTPEDIARELARQGRDEGSR